MKKATAKYAEGLKEALKSPDEAAAYLNAALEDGSQEAFLLALRDVAEARGISNVARQSKLNRENLYRILSNKGNPKLESLRSVLGSIGLKLAVATEE